MRHGEEGEDRANEVLMNFPSSYNIPLIATNNTYYTKKKRPMRMTFCSVLKEGKQATPH